ncbi:LacI family DNA-binding transcriptional regulator [Amycolatopsis vancoresmycina]|uniref:LacI family transcriptional regulator n=1 Tax=Amycolatopsis vancoresmycina DSM 44592 TaxID=1292037 RepID=R1HYK7_9PSEU|nr:LacI family DNA-binding transcriptional regulator [Amycolatopsis vancoresmycina]EOD65396.1 LacI family transcriptional regulator [Amycolatopsis vancoresmycina DSM 44592]
MPSIRDVAKQAQVSTATASRALRGLPAVTAETRARVERVAAELGYVIPFNASSLASGRTNSVGIVVPFVSRWFFGTVVAGAETVLREAGLDLVVYGVPGAPSRERFFAELPVRRRVDAVLVLCLPLTRCEADALLALRIPVVLVGSTADGISSVRIDDVASSARAVRHLVELGHRRIGLLGESDPPPHGFTTPGLRRNGYLRVLAEAGIEPDPDLEVAGRFTATEGEAAMARLLARRNPPSAVFAMSDEMAFGALQALRRARVDVPGGMSVIGFDDHELAAALDLSTIAQPVFAQGERAAGLLLDQLRRQAPPADVVLPTELVRRGTTGPAAALN